MPTSTEDVEDATNTCKPVVMKHFLVSWPGGLYGSIITAEFPDQNVQQKVQQIFILFFFTKQFCKCNRSKERK